MPEILKKIYSFKFTLIYSVGFFYLGGLLLGLPAFICGLMVDACIMHAKSKPRYRKDGTEIRNHGDCAGYWFAYFVIVGLGYSYWIFSNMGPNVNYGDAYNWMKFTEPFTAEMAEHIAFIEKFPKKIAEVVGGWHEPMMRHLYAVFWFTNIIAFPLVATNIYGKGISKTGGDYDKYWLNEIDSQKNKAGNIFVLNILLLIVILAAIGLIDSVVDDIYSGETNFSRTIYVKKYYIFFPFIMAIFPFLITFIISIFKINKELIRRKLNG